MTGTNGKNPLRSAAWPGKPRLRVLHVSWLKRHDPGAGGVERFALYLQRALVEQGHACEIVSWSDYPNHERVESIANPDKALLLGGWAESAYQFDIAVSDGYWGLGIVQHPVVPVVHGTWAQFHINMGAGRPFANREVQAQHQAFNALNAHPVAVSLASSRELLLHHRRRSYAVINNAVDLEEFAPLKEGRLNAPPIVLHAATNEKKGAKLMAPIARELGPAFQVLFMGAQPGEEARAMTRGDIFLHPARHEGNAYALIEAMATGLPIVTTPVGLFEDIGDGIVGRVLPLSATVSQWADAVREVWGDGITPYRAYARRAREASYLVADFEQWKVQWDRALTGVLAGIPYATVPA